MMRNGCWDGRCAHSIRFDDQHAADMWRWRREEHSFTCGSWTVDTFTLGFITSQSRGWAAYPYFNPFLTYVLFPPSFFLLWPDVPLPKPSILSPRIILLPHHHSLHIYLLAVSLSCVHRRLHGHYREIFQCFCSCFMAEISFARPEWSVQWKRWRKMVSMMYWRYFGTAGPKIASLCPFVPNGIEGSNTDKNNKTPVE